MRRHVRSGHHAAESFVSFIPSFGAVPRLPRTVYSPGAMEIVEAFHSYVPPRGVHRDLENLVSTVPADLLLGLGRIRLTNREA